MGWEEDGERFRLRWLWFVFLRFWGFLGGEGCIISWYERPKSSYLVVFRNCEP